MKKDIYNGITGESVQKKNKIAYVIIIIIED